MITTATHADVYRARTRSPLNRSQNLTLLGSRCRFFRRWLGRQTWSVSVIVGVIVIVGGIQ